MGLTAFNRARRSAAGAGDKAAPAGQKQSDEKKQQKPKKSGPADQAAAQDAAGQPEQE